MRKKWLKQLNTDAESTSLTVWCFVQLATLPCPVHTDGTMQSGHSEWDNKNSVMKIRGQCIACIMASTRAPETMCWRCWVLRTSPGHGVVVTTLSDTRAGSKVPSLRSVIMTLGYRDLVSSGLYRNDPIVTDFTFATTLVTLFGPQGSLFLSITRENLRNILFRTHQVVPNGGKWSGTEAQDSRSSSTSLWLHYCG